MLSFFYVLPQSICGTLKVSDIYKVSKYQKLSIYRAILIEHNRVALATQPLKPNDKENTLRRVERKTDDDEYTGLENYEIEEILVGEKI